MLGNIAHGVLNTHTVRGSRPQTEQLIVSLPTAGYEGQP